MLEKDFYTKVEDKTFLKHILYGDTDSIFITIPDNPENLKNDSLETKWEKAENAASGINNLIVKYTKDYIMKRCNFSPDKNQTFFKTELLMDSMMFLDVKKQYAYKLCVKEGNVLETPEIEYTGIQVVKSDAAKLTQDLLRDIIENVVLNTKVINKEQEIVNTINKYIEKVKHDVENYIFSDIAFPGKWAKAENIINGMKIYNHIIGEKIFSPTSAGKWIYCKFDKNKLDLPETKSNVVCVPNDYDPAKIKNVFESYNIEIDLKTQWSKLYTTTCQRVYDLIKKTQAKN